MSDSFSLITASYNTPEFTLTMLKSFVFHNPDIKPTLILIENSTDDKTAKLLDDYGIRYKRNAGGTHSKSIDEALDICETKHVIIVDTDIVFTQSIRPLLSLLENDPDIAMLGEYSKDRGGFRLHPRINPWFCFINVKLTRKFGIRFHDEKRINATGSQIFYGNVPVSGFDGSTNILYDVGSTFFEDIRHTGFKIVNAAGITKYYNHFEGSSWRKNIPAYKELAETFYHNFMKSEFPRYEKADLKDKFTFLDDNNKTHIKKITSGLSIGIGICSYNRPDEARRVANAIKETCKFNTNLVISIDGGDTCAYPLSFFSDLGFEIITGKNKGCGPNKNRIIKHLRDCDYVFIIEDDLTPIKEGWVERYIQAMQDMKVDHFTYVPTFMRKKLMKTHIGECVVQTWDFLGGPLMVMTKKCIEAVGLIDEAFIKYGHEHTNFTQRCAMAGLYPFPGFLHLADADSFLEYNNDAAVTMTTEDKRKFIALNTLRFNKKPEKIKIDLDAYKETT